MSFLFKSCQFIEREADKLNEIERKKKNETKLKKLNEVYQIVQHTENNFY